MSDENTRRLAEAEDVNATLGVRTELATPEKVVLALDVGPRVHQPFGILHGGVSALLAEGAASYAGMLNVAPGQVVVGTELNCSHLRAMHAGVLTATATPIRIGRTVQVWNVDLTDERGRMICVARCSLQVLAAPPGGEGP